MALNGMLAHPAYAADFPGARPIRMVVPFAPGGSSDVVGRLVGTRMATLLKQNIIVDNRAGAGGMIGANWLGQAAPRDGLTFGYLTGVAAATAQGTESLKIDATKLPFVAGFESLGV